LKTNGDLRHSLSQLEQELPPTSQGVAISSIAKYCDENAIPVTVIRTTFSRLTEYHLPAILLVNENHFITLVGTEDDRLVVFDSAYGLVDCTPEWFSKRYNWDGTAIVHGSSLPDFLASEYVLVGSLFVTALSCGCLFLMFRRGAPKDTPHGSGPLDLTIEERKEGGL
jgi:hypothetical protein